LSVAAAMMVPFGRDGSVVDDRSSAWPQLTLADWSDTRDTGGSAEGSFYEQRGR
jgi:hypothetical protein